jgi:hypothetical protein
VSVTCDHMIRAAAIRIPQSALPGYNTIAAAAKCCKLLVSSILVDLSILHDQVLDVHVILQPKITMLLRPVY